MESDGTTVNDNNAIIKVNPNTDNPTAAWDKLKGKQKASIVTDLLPLDTPIYTDKVRFVCISDTHNQIHRLKCIPDGDVLLHAGDFTSTGLKKEVVTFNNFLGTLPHKHKIVIAGNHELSFDERRNGEMPHARALFATNRESLTCPMRDLLTNCTYLEDSLATVYGIKIYGSPWQPEFCDWAFNLPRGQECLDKWNLIPDDVNILMTHGPPIGYGDLCKYGQRAGCVELLETIQKRVKPKYHISGHIHEGYGVTTDGFTTFINASSLDVAYRPVNQPVIFDLDLKEGFTKQSI